MSTNLPVCEEEMLSIQHVTKANYLKYGAKLLDITAAYAAEKMGENFHSNTAVCFLLWCFFIYLYV